LGKPESVKSDISELQKLLDTVKDNLHAATLISIERYSQNAQIGHELKLSEGKE